MAKNKVYALIIQGLVQGVGFRPFIYRIAKDLGMKGCVENMNNGVRILVAATPDDRDLLISRIRDRKSTRLNSSHSRKSRMPSSA